MTEIIVKPAEESEVARIRSVRPDLWARPLFASVTLQARLLWIGLLNEADDEGRIELAPKRIAGVVFPNDADVGAREVQAWLRDLGEAGLIRPYEVDGRWYALMLWFGDQKPKYPSKSTLPAPPLSLIPPILEEASPSPTPLEYGVRSTESEMGEGVMERHTPPVPISPQQPPEARMIERGAHVPAQAVAALLKATVAATRPTRARTIVGLIEAEHRPASPEAWVAAPGGQTLQKQLVALDGKNGRPTLTELVAGMWVAFTDKAERDGNQAAERSIVVWIKRDYAKIRIGYEQDLRFRPGEVAPVVNEAAEAAKRRTKALLADRKAAETGAVDGPEARAALARMKGGL